MKFMRPPMGEFSERTLINTANLGYKTVMWSFAYKDWEEKKQPQEQEALKIIQQRVPFQLQVCGLFHSGEIMLLHGNSKTNTNLLAQIIKQAREQGYEFASLEEYQE